MLERKLDMSGFQMSSGEFDGGAIPSDESMPVEAGEVNRTETIEELWGEAYDLIENQDRGLLWSLVERRIGGRINDRLFEDILTKIHLVVDRWVKLGDDDSYRQLHEFCKVRAYRVKVYQSRITENFRNREASATHYSINGPSGLDGSPESARGDYELSLHSYLSDSLVDFISGATVRNKLLQVVETEEYVNEKMRPVLRAIIVGILNDSDQAEIAKTVGISSERLSQIFKSDFLPFLRRVFPGYAKDITNFAQLTGYRKEVGSKKIKKEYKINDREKSIKMLQELLREIQQKKVESGLEKNESGMLMMLEYLIDPNANSRPESLTTVKMRRLRQEIADRLGLEVNTIHKHRLFPPSKGKGRPPKLK